MEWTSPWVIGPLCAGLGVFVGMLIMLVLDRGSGSAKALGALQEEFDSYRDNVNRHFDTTSELFKDMTEKYRDVYNHLASGAQEFGRNADTPPRLEIVQPAAQLGAAAAVADAGASSQRAEPAVEVADGTAEEGSDAQTQRAARDGGADAGAPASAAADVDAPLRVVDNAQTDPKSLQGELPGVNATAADQPVGDGDGTLAGKPSRATAPSA